MIAKTQDGYKVLHIQKVAGIAGSENHLLTLLPRLREYGYEPTMLVLADRRDRPKRFIERMRAAGVPTSLMLMRGHVDPFLVPRLIRFIKQGRYDIVHTHLLHADLYGRLAAKIVGVKLVSTYHCDDPYHLIPGVKQADQWTGKMCDAVICISNNVRGFVRWKIGLPEGRLHTVYYGLDSVPTKIQRWSLREELGIRESDPLIGIVARLHEQKGHVYLLQAMKLLIESYPATHLVIVGDGPLRSYLEAFTKNLALEEHVHFLGYQQDGAKLMHAFDIFVHPSLYEGFGLAVLEAMMVGKPIVATRVSAIPELVIHGKTGLLVPPRDVGALADAICKLLENPSLAKELGRQARKRAEEHFSVGKMVDSTVRIYHRVLVDGNNR